uniref:Peptidase A1 domain-containing protein n=1 Tax=Rhabditophanes sp. KR3021 TaxID=114890 RepID=A0AC35TH45_9BILA
MSLLKDKPRGLGLLRLPTGVTDERAGLLVPGLRIPGKLNSGKPQTLQEASQAADLTGKSSFDPFTNTVGTSFVEDGFGLGYGVSGFNNYGLSVRDNLDAYSDMKLKFGNGQMQPFLTSVVVGGYDRQKMREAAVLLEAPLPFLKEMFGLESHIMMKANGLATMKGGTDFPLTLSDPGERYTLSGAYVQFYADRHIQYGHKILSVNLFNIDRRKIVNCLIKNRASSASVG